VAGLTAARATWQAAAAAGAPVTVQVRSGHRASPARLTGAGEDRFEVAFEAPVDAAAPGQAAVAYDGEVLLGGGWIERTRPAGATAP
jgi:tRNA-specific 2-thiouridylase